MKNPRSSTQYRIGGRAWFCSRLTRKALLMVIVATHIGITTVSPSISAPPSFKKTYALSPPSNFCSTLPGLSRSEYFYLHSEAKFFSKLAARDPRMPFQDINASLDVAFRAHPGRARILEMIANPYNDLSMGELHLYLRVTDGKYKDRRLLLSISRPAESEDGSTYTIRPWTLAEQMLEDLDSQGDPRIREALELLLQDGLLNESTFEGYSQVFRELQKRSLSRNYEEKARTLLSLVSTGHESLLGAPLLLDIARNCFVTAPLFFHYMEDLSGYSLKLRQQARERSSDVLSELSEKLVDRCFLAKTARREGNLANELLHDLCVLADVSLQSETCAQSTLEVLRQDNFAIKREWIRLKASLHLKKLPEDIIALVSGHIAGEVSSHDRLNWLMGVTSMLRNEAITPEDSLDDWRDLFEGYIPEFGFLASRRVVLAYRHLKHGREISDDIARDIYLLAGDGELSGEQKLARLREEVNRIKGSFLVTGEIEENATDNELILEMVAGLTGYNTAPYGHRAYARKAFRQFLDERRPSVIPPLRPESLAGEKAHFRLYPPEEGRAFDPEGSGVILERFRKAFTQARKIHAEHGTDTGKAFEVIRNETRRALLEKRPAEKEITDAPPKKQKGLRAKDELYGTLFEEIARSGELSGLVDALLSKHSHILGDEHFQILLLRALFMKHWPAAEDFPEKIDDLNDMELTERLIAFSGKVLQAERKRLKDNKTAVKGLRKLLREKELPNILDKLRKDKALPVEAFISKGLIAEMAGDIGNACYTKVFDIMSYERMVGAVIFVAGEGTGRRPVASVLLLENSINGHKVWILRAINPDDSTAQIYDMHSFLENAMGYIRDLAKEAGVEFLLVPSEDASALSNRPRIHKVIGSFIKGPILRLDSSENFNNVEIRSACRMVALPDEDEREVLERLRRLTAENLNTQEHPEDIQTRKMAGEINTIFRHITSDVNSLHAGRDTTRAEPLAGDITIDTSLLSRDTLENDIRTWAYLILSSKDTTGYRFVFRSPGVGDEKFPLERDAVTPEEAFSLLTREIRRLAGLHGITNPGAFLKERVGTQKREGAVEIAIMARDHLERAREESLPLGEKQYPVALARPARDKPGHVPVYDFQAALGVAIAKSALIDAKLSDDGCPERLAEVTERTLPRIRHLYSALSSRKIKISAATLKNMISDNGTVRMNLAISIALPPAAVLPIERIRQHIEHLHMLLRSA